jgi:hypothetical protein
VFGVVLPSPVTLISRAAGHCELFADQVFQNRYAFAEGAKFYFGEVGVVRILVMMPQILLYNH